MESACDIFHAIYGDSGQSNIISDLLKRPDFLAPPPITLLATIAPRKLTSQRVGQTAHVGVSVGLQREPGSNN